MKQKKLLFTLVAGLAFVVLSSNDNGPAAGTGGNCTGSAGSTQSCSGGGACHAPNTTATTAQVMLTDTGSTTALTSYTPGKKYYLRIVGGHATLSKYGFQVSTVKSSSTNTQAGTLAVGGSSTANTAIHSIGALQFFEHTLPLTATVIAGAQVYGANCYWTAPVAGTGAVKLYAMVNGVNGNSLTSGDAPNAAAIVTISEASSSVATTSNIVDFKVYPNPAVNTITVAAEGISNGNCAISVYDMRGKLMHTETTEASIGSLNTTVNASKWAAGLYFVQIVKDNQQKVIPVEKL